MPKGIDPKAYAARITKAKKIVAAMDPATRAKLKEMYPKITKEAVANSALNPKKANMKKSKSMEKMPARKMPEGVEFPKSKKTMPNKPATKRPGTAKPAPLPKKPKTLTGPAAVDALQKRVSPSGVKKAEMDAKKATKKKYPGLYKK